MMMRLFPELFSRHRVAPVAHYPDLLLETLRSVAPAGGQRPDGRRAHARHVQQRLLRARLPRPADGDRAGRGAGPLRQGQLRLHADDAGAQARRRHLPPRRRRLPRSARLPRRLDARLRRAARRLPRRQRDAVERDRHRRRRRQVDLSVRAEDDRVLPRRKADPAERADLRLPRPARPRLRARPPRRAGRQGSARRRRLRHAGRPGVDRGRDRGFPRRAEGRTRTATSRSRRWRCRPARPSSRAASRRATSTCGRSCSRARPCRWCPAG